MIDWIAAIGDAADPGCWSGIPFHFGAAARRTGLSAQPVRLLMEKFAGARCRWNVAQLLQGRAYGGYQYSTEFLERAEALASSAWNGRVLTFNQHFPRAKTVERAGGQLLAYVDATFASACTDGGFAAHLPPRVRSRAILAEQENYRGCTRVVAMSRWAAAELVRSCLVEEQRVATILPGANLSIPVGHGWTCPPGEPGLERPLVLGFVGKDWRRKGLPFLLQVRAVLVHMGVPALVRAAGHCPEELRHTPGLEYVGFIDKARQPAAFLEFLSSCDVGCLFSEREPLGISTLEFLRAGVPVAGFVIEGIADTLPIDAGFRFESGTRAEIVAEVFRAYVQNPADVKRRREAALAWSPLMTWERCVGEWLELLQTGRIATPVQPWRGIEQGGGNRPALNSEILRSAS